VASIVARCDVLAFNRVIGFGEAGPVNQEDVERLIQLYAEAGARRAFVQINPVAVDASVFETFSVCGLRHHNNWAKLYRDTHPLPSVATDLRIELIEKERAADFAAVVTEAFDWPDILRPWIAQLVGRKGWRHYMAFEGMHGVATAALYVSGEWGWIDLAATAEDYRGRGAQGKLLELRIADARAAGCKFISVETAEQTPDHEAPSHRNMIRYGFQEAFIRPNYLWTAAK
jgi:GNAT superfamily N-acetyltransferase